MFDRGEQSRAADFKHVGLREHRRDRVAVRILAFDRGDLTTESRLDALRLFLRLLFLRRLLRIRLAGGGSTLQRYSDCTGRCSSGASVRAA